MTLLSALLTSVEMKNGLAVLYHDHPRKPQHPIANNLTTIRRALEDAGVEFFARNGGSAGVRHGKRVE